MESININWNTLLGALGPSGILIWYLWHTQSVTLPSKDASRAKEVAELQAAHKSTIEVMATRFHDSLNRIVDGFRADLKEERAARAAEIAAMRESFRCHHSPNS
jgi:hypothetical protein